MKMHMPACHWGIGQAETRAVQAADVYAGIEDDVWLHMAVREKLLAQWVCRALLQQSFTLQMGDGVHTWTGKVVRQAQGLCKALLCLSELRI